MTVVAIVIREHSIVLANQRPTNHSPMRRATSYKGNRKVLMTGHFNTRKIKLNASRTPTVDINVVKKRTQNRDFDLQAFYLALHYCM